MTERGVLRQDIPPPPFVAEAGPLIALAASRRDP